MGGVGRRDPPAVIANFRHIQPKRSGKDALRLCFTVKPRTILEAKREIRGRSDSHRVAHSTKCTGERRHACGGQ